MNLVLFEKHELNLPLTRQDRRFKHICRILKAAPGDKLIAGILDGPIGYMLIKSISRTSIEFTFTETGSPPPLLPIHIICGLSRPQQVKRILRDCTSMGVSSIWFPHTQLGQKSYHDSPIWKNNSWMPYVFDGLEQSAGTLQPDIRVFHSIKVAIDSLPENVKCVILDNDDSHARLENVLENKSNIALVIGSERGWTELEKQKFKNTGAVFGYLGKRILRTDTACISATALALASLRKK